MNEQPSKSSRPEPLVEDVEDRQQALGRVGRAPLDLGLQPALVQRSSRRSRNASDEVLLRARSAGTASCRATPERAMIASMPTARHAAVREQLVGRVEDPLRASPGLRTSRPARSRAYQGRRLDAGERGRPISLSSTGAGVDCPAGDDRAAAAWRGSGRRLPAGRPIVLWPPRSGRHVLRATVGVGCDRRSHGPAGQRRRAVLGALRLGATARVRARGVRRR